MRDGFRFRPPRLSSGTVRAAVFLVLVSLAIGFWFYTERIITHVRNLQKTVVNTQKNIYLTIINPGSTDMEGISTDLFEEVVQYSTFPSIFSDRDNRPIPGYWRNVGVSPDDTTEASRRKLEQLIRRMDRINPPDSLPNYTLVPRTDTLWVYESPPDPSLPVGITDQIGEVLATRNIPVIGDSLEIDFFNTLDPTPVRFSREGEPSLTVYGVDDYRPWPVIVTRADGSPLYWRDVGVAASDTSAVALDRLERLIITMRAGGERYRIVTRFVTGTEIWLFHYGDPQFVTLIAWLPIIELAVIMILIVVGFIGFRNITKAEQRSIWVGMAKETAHQLGTPISSIDGWLELLRSERDEELVAQAVQEIGLDVQRLTRVAARFSSIGSRPELQPIEVSDVIEEVLGYFRVRVPHYGRVVELSSRCRGLAKVRGNHELLNWAVENIIKNALAAIDTQHGRIEVTGSMSKDFRHVVIDFTDNGRGIVPADQKQVMQPGFTTKKRGWGLGLSLVKRIVEDYHGGSFILLESIPGEGSTFRMIFPAIKEPMEKS